jgi:hypothetical protein
MATAICYGVRGGGAQLCFQVRAGNYDTDSLIEVLGALRRFLGGEKATLLWDGLPAHRSAAMRAWLTTQRSWLVVERLPANAPELNRVEGLWSCLKAVELANLCSPTLGEVIQQAHRGIDRVRGTPHLTYSLLRHAGLSVSQQVVREGGEIIRAPLAERGCHIVAVEPGDNLARVARRNLAEFPHVQVEVAAFEDWPLPPEPFDSWSPRPPSTGWTRMCALPRWPMRCAPAARWRSSPRVCRRRRPGVPRPAAGLLPAVGSGHAGGLRLPTGAHIPTYDEELYRAGGLVRCWYAATNGRCATPRPHTWRCLPPTPATWHCTPSARWPVWLPRRPNRPLLRRTCHEALSDRTAGYSPTLRWLMFIQPAWRTVQEAPPASAAQGLDPEPRGLWEAEQVLNKPDTPHARETCLAPSSNSTGVNRIAAMACCTARRSSRKLTKDGADNTRSRCSGVWMTDSSPRPLVHRSPLVAPTAPVRTGPVPPESPAQPALSAIAAPDQRPGSDTHTQRDSSRHPGVIGSAV